MKGLKDWKAGMGSQMKKIAGILLIAMTAMMAAGCVSMPVKQGAEVLPKASNIYLEKATLCKLRAVGIGLQISFEEPIDNPSAEQLEVVECYRVSLKNELEKRGFILGDDSTREGTLIIKTKMGEIPPNLISITRLGLIGVEIEVWNSSGKLLLSFQQAVNTHPIGSPAKKQVGKFIAPRVAEQLRKKSL